MCRANGPYPSQFEPEGTEVGLIGHMSAIPDNLRRFFSDALKVVVPMHRFGPFQLLHALQLGIPLYSILKCI